MQLWLQSYSSLNKEQNDTTQEIVIRIIKNGGKSLKIKTSYLEVNQTLYSEKYSDGIFPVWRLKFRSAVALERKPTS